LDSQVEEKQLLKDVLLTLHLYDYLANHNYDSRRSGPDAGVPDINPAAGHGRLIFIETKTLKGPTAKKQREWERRIRASGNEYYHWTPADWSSGAIDRILRPAWMKGRTP
jgi:hypothetical protein